jgi:2',3'-cyclic-nucleotide 2'-phosphodiesterase (5'-nucleotidase family)
MKQRIFSLVVSFIFLLSFINLSFADNKISILVSGQSHASLYPCICPKSPSGGLSRRATAIKNIKSKGEDVILLEAGGSFAGGNYDTNSQTTELDKERTQFYMKSLLVMGYDAFLVSSEEFNFGDDFLNEVMADYPLN